MELINFRARFLLLLFVDKNGSHDRFRQVVERFNRVTVYLGFSPYVLIFRGC